LVALYFNVSNTHFVIGFGLGLDVIVITCNDAYFIVIYRATTCNV